MLDQPPSQAMLAWLQRRQAPEAPPELAPDMPGEKPTAPMATGAIPHDVPADPPASMPPVQAMPNPGEMVQKLQAAQASDTAARNDIANRAEWSSLLGHKIAPETLLRLREPHAAADLIAQPTFREHNAKAGADEAELPYAASQAKSKADLEAAHAAQFQQLAESGAAKDQFENSLRQGIENGDETTAALIKGQAKNLMPEMADAIDKAPTRLVYGMLDQFQKTHGSDVLNERAIKAAIIAANAKRDVANINMGGGSGSGPPDSAVVEQGTDFYAKTGKMPPAATGKAGTALRNAIQKRYTDKYPHGDVASATASTHANAASLSHAQTSADQVDQAEATANKNLDQFLGLAGKVVDSGSPWINKPLRSIDRSVLGSTDQAAFDTARQVAISEIAKVLGGSTGAVTDSVRHEVEGLIGHDASLKQIMSAAKILKVDMANRKSAVHGQIDEIGGRISAKPSGGADAPETKPKRKTINGVTYEQRGDEWHTVGE